jgi:hypothetical protein
MLIAQNNSEYSLRERTSEILQITQECRMIGTNSLVIYFAETAKFANSHWANSQFHLTAACLGSE